MHEINNAFVVVNNDTKITLDRATLNGQDVEFVPYEKHINSHKHTVKMSIMLDSSVGLRFDGSVSVSDVSRLFNVLGKYENKQLTIDEVCCILKEIGFEEVKQ